MHSWHAKSPCCRAKIHHFGSRRHQCSYCKRTWRIRNKRRGRKLRRAHPQSLKAVFLEIGLFHRRFDDRRNLPRRLGCRNIGPDHIRFARHIGPDYGRMRAARLHSRPNQVIVCSLTRFQPPCNPSIAARIKTFWPGFTTAQQSSISLIATAASAGSKR